jgi:peptidoglycan hydrolase CwlO-like protein
VSFFCYKKILISYLHLTKKALKFLILSYTVLINMTSHKDEKKSFYFLIISIFIFNFIFINIGNAQILPTLANADQASERKALEQELAALEAESKQIQATLTSKKGQRAGLERDLSLVTSKIAASKNQISKLSVTIKKIGTEIDAKENKIGTLEERIDQNRDFIVKTLQELRKLDDVRAVVALSGENTLSDVFSDRGGYKALQESLGVNVDRLQLNKKFVEIEKGVLEDKKDESEALKVKQEREKKKSEIVSAEKKTLVTIAKGEEKQYANLLAEKQAKAGKIKARLFVLRDTGGITFDKAQSYALQAEKATGVRAALILGILKQESNIGSNVGRCYLKDPATGAGQNVNGTYMANVMKANRDVQPFLNMMKELGKDPFMTRVSCPVPGLGYGGAMGPTQFIPSTWVSYRPRVIVLTGGGGDPWNAFDAIFATALYLKDKGAARGDYSSERTAACGYYTGGGCGKSGGAGYGNSVMRHAENFQDDIDLLKEVN